MKQVPGGLIWSELLSRVETEAGGGVDCDFCPNTQYPPSILGLPLWLSWLKNPPAMQETWVQSLNP